MKTTIYRHTMKLLTLLLLASSTLLNAQQLKLGTNPSVTQKSALLELESNSQGLLLPRITDTTQVTIKTAPDGMIIFLTLNNSLYIRAGGQWHKLIPEGEALRSMNGSTAPVQTITATSNAAPASLTTLGGNHFLNLPDASTTYSGFIGTGAQTFAGAKTFNGNLTAYQDLLLPNIIVDNTKDSVLLIDAGKVWKKRLTGLPPTGAASGDLSGTYPSPVIAAGAITGAKMAQGGATPGQVLKWNGTTWAPAADNNTGSLSSVGLTATPAVFTVGNSPLTANGDITLGLQTQTANTVFAGPGTGAAAVPTFRALAAGDIPALPFSKITTGVVPIAQGGTGLSAPGTTGYLLVSTGTGLTYMDPVLGGDVINNAFANSIAPKAVTYAKMQDVTTQKILGRYAATNGSTQEISLNNSLKLTTGGILYADSSLAIWNASRLLGRSLSPLAPATGQVLKYNGTTWEPAADNNSAGLSSVGLTATPAVFTVGNTPLTANGDITLGLQTQAANTVFAGPGTGTAVPTFRALAAADIPTLPFSKISGTVPIAQGGTALTAVGAAGTVLTSNGTSLTYTAPAVTLAGDVTGASGSNTIAAGAVTYAKMQNVTSQRLLGRYAATAGSTQEVTLNNSLKLTTAGTLYADSSLAIWNASRILGLAVSPKAPATGEVLKWNGTTWESNSDNDGGATYGTIGFGNAIDSADVAGSTTRMKIWNSRTTGTVVNGPLGTGAYAWSVLAFKGVDFTTQLYFDKNTLAVKEWAGNNAPLTTNTGNGWYKMISTNGNTNIANGSVIFGNITSDATSEVGQDNANLFWDNGPNKRLGIGTNTPVATLSVNGGVSMKIRLVTINANNTYNVTDEDYTVIKTNNTNNTTIALPSPAGREGRIFVIKRISATGSVTIAASNIDGGTADSMNMGNVAGRTYTFQAMGNSWYIIGAYGE